MHDFPEVKIMGTTIEKARPRSVFREMNRDAELSVLTAESLA